jgi:hypothetical protein
MKRLAVKKIGRKTDKPFLSEPPRYRPLAVVEASITVHEHNRCPRIARGRPGEKTIDDLLPAFVSRMHRDDSFSHGHTRWQKGRRSLRRKVNGSQPAKRFM